MRRKTAKTMRALKLRERFPADVGPEPRKIERRGGILCDMHVQVLMRFFNTLSSLGPLGLKVVWSRRPQPETCSYCTERGSRHWE